MPSEIRLRTLEIVFAAIFASIAVYMTMAKLVFPFPILSYLRFELAEIPVIIVFLISGPAPSLTSAVIYWAILNFVGEWVPLGPAMKFLSLAPTLLGLWAGLILHHRFLKGRGGKAASLILGISLAIVARVLVTSLLNFVILWYLFPFFLDIASESLKSALGLDIPSSIAALLWSLLFTAIFNVMHTFLSVIPSYAVIRAVALTKMPGLGRLWIDKATMGK